ncbi:hypothetical protein BAE44_0018415 [Dichanthelium oligosanthes]|uniref:Knottin scorpion toxin-like domain-containing protein n=1 Tax=Dichanthelium oligosanthes TaxID=888268 RepID=A0A1E5V6E9_9POAL|nr:hypothetical protein BAE44_0018415 [Dichanthelium oligosanthes]
MAPRIAVLTILLLMVSLVFAGRVKGEQPGGGSQGQEPVAVASGVFPKSECGETRLYRGGPCVEAFCRAACLLQMRQGGHCKGNLFNGGCYYTASRAPDGRWSSCMDSARHRPCAAGRPPVIDAATLIPSIVVSLASTLRVPRRRIKA